MAKKNAKGGGTIRKKTVTRNGKPYVYWEARITTGRDSGTGKQIQRSFTGKTQKEVREKMQAAAVEVNQGTYTAPQRISIVAYKMDTQQTVSLVLDTIRLAKRKEKVSAGRLQLHSDQGSQYTSQAYFDLTKEYGITPSMSRRGNCYDNAMAENFFSILKTECIYRQKLKSFQQARELIDEFIHFYHYERIQLKTGETPLARRLSA